MARLARMPDELKDAVRQHRFRKAGFTCSCENCQKKPAWCYSDNKIIKIIKNISLYFGFMAILFFVLALINGENLVASSIALKAILPAGIVFALCLIWDLIFLTVKKAAISKLDEKYMPQICETPEKAEKLKEKMEKES